MKRVDKEPKILRVPSPGDGRYWEQIENSGEQKYVFYQPPDDLVKKERWSTDTFHMITDDEDRTIHYYPMKRPLWLLPGEPLEPGLSLWDDVKSYVYNHIEFPDGRLYDVATAWILLTWNVEAFDVAPYFRFLGSKNTGKTRGLEVFQHLCYRATLTPSVTEAVLYRLCQDLHVTYLLDETEHYSNEAKTAIQNVLNSGHRRGQQVLRCITAEDGSYIIGGFDVYGPKGIAGTRQLNDTLESRCIQVVMARNRRQVNFTMNKAAARELRSRLLLWRFRRLHDLEVISEQSEDSEPSEGYLGPPQILHSIGNTRIVELFAPLMALADNFEAQENILNYALEVYQNTQEEDATGSEAEVLNAIIKTYPELQSGKFSTRMATTIFNEGKPEIEHWKAHSIGRIIKRLGFKPKRMTGGAAGWIYDADLVNKLTEQYEPVKDGDTPPMCPSLPSLYSLTSLEQEEYAAFMEEREEHFKVEEGSA